MSQQPHQDFNIEGSSFQQAQIAQAGGDLHQIQNANIYSLLNLAGLFRPRLVTPSDRKDFDYRKILLNKVKQYWVQDVLEKSLHHNALIELGLEERLNAVERPSEIALEDWSYSRQPLPKDRSNIDVFKQMGAGRTLLILGDPGAGKTTFLLRLAKNLIADAEENLSLPIPIVFNLSSWKSKRQNIANWLIQELNSKYKVSKSLAKLWIQNQQLLLLLDGLDEVKAESRDACVQALNEFMKNYGETEMALCSRITDYELLSHRLSMQRGICIQSLTTEQINQYLDRAGNQLQGVKTLLQTDTALQELVKSPLMLSIITLAYQSISIEDLPKANSAEEHRKYLFDRYIKRMFDRRGTNKLYPEKQAKTWLAWLAYKMSQNSQTIFSIEHMQPRWLINGWQKLIYRIGIIVFSFLITGGFLTFAHLVIIILLPKFESIQEVANSLDNKLLLGFSLGLFGVINSWLINKDEIILPTERWKLSKKKAFKGLINGIRIGLFWGTLIGIIFLIYYILFVPNVFSSSLKEDNIFSNKFIGLFTSLTSGIIFTLLFKIIKKVFYFSKTKFIISSHHNLKLFFKQVLVQGICIGIFIWITTWIIPGKLITLMIGLTVLISIFIPISSFFFALLFGIIGVVSFGRDTIEIQKNIASANLLKQALINTTISCVIGLSLGVSIGGMYIISGNYFGFLQANLKDINQAIKFIIICGSLLGVFGLTKGFAYIQHLTLRLIFYRYNYITWNYTRFLEYATERILLQKVGGGYIFVHRLLLEHFAAFYQPSRLSLNTRSNLPIIKKYKVLLLFITIILVTLLGYQFRKEREKYVQNFIEYLEDSSRQIDYYSSQIQKNPKNARNYTDRGDAYRQKKDYDRAIADYTQVLKLDPKSLKAYNGRGLAYKGKKDYDRAIADYTQAIALDPKPYVYNNRGDAYYNKKDYVNAIADYTQVLKLSPKHVYAYNNRANAYYNKKDYDRAIADYTQAIALDSKSTYAYYNRGNAYKNKGSKDKAIEDFKKVLKLNDDEKLSQFASEQLQKLGTK